MSYPLVIIRGVDQRAARPFVVSLVGAGATRHVRAATASPVFWAGATPASDRAAAAVAGPPLAVSVLLLLSMTRGKKPVRKQKMYVILAKGSQT